MLGHDCSALTEHKRARVGFINEEHSLPAWLRVDELVSMQRRLYPNCEARRIGKPLSLLIDPAAGAAGVPGQECPNRYRRAFTLMQVLTAFS